MNVQDFVAYIGAAAWLPHIGRLIYNQCTKPVLKIVPNQFAEVSYTAFGPIFNIKVAMISEKKSLLIEDIELEIKHSDGTTHNLRWAGIIETFSEITDNFGNRQVISKELTPTAMRLQQDYLNEKTIRFQEPKYHDIDKELTNKLASHISYLKGSEGKVTKESISKSQEMHNLVKYRESKFNWKIGSYTGKFKVKSSSAFIFLEDNFKFNIESTEVEMLTMNIPFLKTFLIESIYPPVEKSEVVWNWINPKIKK